MLHHFMVGPPAAKVGAGFMEGDCRADLLLPGPDKGATETAGILSGPPSITTSGKWQHYLKLL